MSRYILFSDVVWSYKQSWYLNKTVTCAGFYHRISVLITDMEPGSMQLNIYLSGLWKTVSFTAMLTDMHGDDIFQQFQNDKIRWWTITVWTIPMHFQDVSMFFMEKFYPHFLLNASSLVVFIFIITRECLGKHDCTWLLIVTWSWSKC